MKKSISIIILVFGMSLMIPQTLYAGGSTDANLTRITSVAGAGLSGTYAKKMWACCSSTRATCCFKAAAASALTIELLRSAKDAGKTARALNNGSSFGFDPTEAGFCFDKTTGCTPDEVDLALEGFKDPFKQGTGYEKPILEMETAAVERLAGIDKKGFKIDKDAQTVTSPTGQVFGFDEVKMPESLSKKMSHKLAGVEKALKGKTKDQGRAVASADETNSVDIIFEDEYITGPENSKKTKLEDKKKEFLAGLSDKDAKGDVGFAGDNIFDMIQRRYRKKLENKELFTEAD